MASRIWKTAPILVFPTLEARWALAIGENNMGLDIEAVRSFHQRVPERIMSREEYDWFCSRGELKRDFSPFGR